jgi:hypothetical protein
LDRQETKPESIRRTINAQYPQKSWEWKDKNMERSRYPQS